MLWKKKAHVAGLKTSPWIILGATAILIGVVLALALQNTRRDRRYLTEMLSTKGAALIRAVEAGTRTGMRMMWGGAQVQRLLEETAQLPDVLYMAIVAPDGTALAHSDPARIGNAFRADRRIIHLGPEFEENWEMVTLDDGRAAFEVHRHFRPLPTGMHGRGRTLGIMPPPGIEGAPEWLDPQKGRQLLIVIGLDVSPIEKMIHANIRNTVILSVILLLLGVAGFAALFWMYSYRAARRSLQDTSAFADEVVAHLPVGLIAVDPHGRIAFFNAAAGQIAGIDPAQALNQMPERVLPPHLCGLKSILDRGVAIREREMVCDFTGRAVPVSVSGTRIVNAAGQLVGHILILRDLAQVKQLQAEIRRQEKLAALGGLAAGVAHEIRNPLSSIKGLATYFAGKFEAGSEERSLAQVMTQEVDRLNRVISELLEFARPADLNRSARDINPLLRHCLTLVGQDAAQKGIALHDDLAEGLCLAWIDPDRLSQCLLNLYINAIEAMGRGGRLTVVSEPVDAAWLRIRIEDTGGGIAAEDLDRIFNPYFTTKSQGTGLGLAIVHKITESHGGRIQVDSTPRVGTRVTLLLPCAARPTEKPL